MYPLRSESVFCVFSLSSSIMEAVEEEPEEWDWQMGPDTVFKSFFTVWEHSLDKILHIKEHN